jgi:transcriptional regulator with GAF, ATPase, and Fis domain
MTSKTSGSKVSSSSALMKKLSILVQIHQAISRNLNLQEALKATLKILHDLYHTQCSAIYLLDETESTINVASAIR